MKNTNSGRPVDLSSINVEEIKDWMKHNTQARKAIICQSIISLSNGISMTDVCTVLQITRETVRLWKKQLRTGGLNGLLTDKKKGKRSRISVENQKELRKILMSSPKKQGLIETKWTGKMVQEIVLKKWNYKISIRTAQFWMKL